MSCLLAEHMLYKGKVRAARQTGIGEGLGARFQRVRSELHHQHGHDPMLRLFLAFSSSYDCCAMMEGCKVSNGEVGEALISWWKDTTSVKNTSSTYSSRVAPPAGEYRGNGG